MRLIPGKTKVEIELFKGVTLPDILVGGVAASMVVTVLLSSLPGKFYIAIGIAVLAAGLLVRVDTVPNYRYLLHILRHLGYTRSFVRLHDDEILKSRNSGKGNQGFQVKEKKEPGARRGSSKKSDAARAPMEQITAFTDIGNGLIEYGGKYYGAVLEIPAVEFRFFSSFRRSNAIENGLGSVLRTLNAEYSANIVKIDRPIMYDEYLQLEYVRLEELKRSFEQGMLSEPEYKARVEILYDRINDVRKLCYDEKVIEPFYYLVLFDSDKRQLNNQVDAAIASLRATEMSPKRLDDKQIAVFLKYTNQIDFDEREIGDIAPEDYAEWAMPQTVDVKSRTVEVNHIITHNLRTVAYPTEVGDAWLASVMSMPGTKVVVKCRPMERTKAVRGIDRSLQELRGQYMATGVDSRRIELQNHIDTLRELLTTLQQDNEMLLEVNIYITVYDIAATRANTSAVQPPKSDRTVISNMKRAVRRCYQENGFRLNNMEFDQMQAYIGSQISSYDPLLRQGRGIPSNSLAACFPWIFAHVSDKGGIRLGSSQGVPVFIDFFRRDSERVNSNMVIVGKSGSGKSYATKSLLSNLAADDCKVFILDPENEYTELAENLHGKFINVGNSQFGRLNPFQIITALDDDEIGGSAVSGSYATHLQFLEEFFRQILPDCDKDALEYLNSLVDRMYTNKGITGETDLSRLDPEDYPVFDDLYDTVLSEFQQSDNEYIRTILRTLMNYVAKFSTGGRNANIWNGPSTVTTDENFTVFNFQSLISNRNSTIANAQMLLVLKYIDNEIIKNRDYNTKYGLHRKIVVVIDEAHVFIDTKFPVALDFMFQLAKRIRKYNGMQIVITQNIKDFVGSEDIARKSTAIINACQYSFIFALAPNDIQDLCTLYEKAGGINEIEQEQIMTAPRGQAFTVMSPTSRSTFRVEVPQNIVSMFRERGRESRYFSGESGEKMWEDFVTESRRKHLESCAEHRDGEEPAERKQTVPHGRVTFIETDDETEANAGIQDASAGSSGEEASASADESVAALYPETVKPGSADAGNALADMFSRFSYDALMHEIRRSVESTVDARMKELQAEPSVSDGMQTGAEPDETYISQRDDKQKPEKENESDLVNAPDSRTELPQESTGESETTASGAENFRRDAESSADNQTETGSGNDILSLLRADMSGMELPTPIETMEMFGEDVVDVTLEELIRYNREQRGKRRHDSRKGD